MQTLKNNKPLLILFVFFLTSGLFSCHSGPAEVEFFLVKVDSINVPNEIVSNTPFEIDFVGTVGTNGCNQFELFKNSINGNDILIEAWGSVNVSAGKCPAVMVYLTGHKLSVTVPAPGDYTIKIKQPDSNILTKQIKVN
jgi:hypothetical protein